MVTEHSGIAPWRDAAPYRVLVVDDMATNRMLVRATLAGDAYRVSEAVSGEQALELLAREAVDVVLLDVNMPGIGGIETCRRIRADEPLRLLPVVMLTTQEAPEDIVRGLDAGATDYIIKPFERRELMARLRAAAEHKRALDHLDEAESVLFALARMVEAKDENTGDHCDRLAHVSVVFGRALGLPHDDLEALRKGGVLHDIGKLGIPDSILGKKGPLTVDEWVIMKKHAEIGAALCSPLKTMRKTVDIVLHHHEKWDGSGYPHGLAGQDIPLLARVFQIVDIYDALASERPYKPAWSRDRIIATLQEEADKDLRDRELIAAFLDILKTRPEALQLPTDRRANLDQKIFGAIEEAGTIAWARDKYSSCMIG
ncbi:MAG: response regulator [Rhodocyclaceae bacterium]|nr:response regulator [Rhodocyclaceae bacterium]